MTRYLRMRCANCGHWNKVPANKIFIEQNTIKPKVNAYVPMNEPLEVTKCENYGDYSSLRFQSKLLPKIIRTETTDICKEVP